MTSAPENSNHGPYSPGGLQFPEFYLQKHNPRQPDMSPDLGLRAGDAIPLRGSASSATSPRCSSHASLGEEDDDAPVVLDRCRFWTVDEGCRQRMVRCKVAVGPGLGVFLPFLGVGDGTEEYANKKESEPFTAESKIKTVACSFVVGSSIWTVPVRCLLGKTEEIVRRRVAEAHISCFLWHAVFTRHYIFVWKRAPLQ
ncbi:hypothetical protein E4U25_005129 [Claviceps purpurea]|nr:hypothetical protein E4U25_005129 [Claviceps purpurea]